jgi:hypothetical protein
MAAAEASVGLASYQCAPKYRIIPLALCEPLTNLVEIGIRVVIAYHDVHENSGILGKLAEPLRQVGRKCEDVLHPTKAEDRH